MSRALLPARCCSGTSNGGWPWFPCGCLPPLPPAEPQPPLTMRSVKWCWVWADGPTSPFSSSWSLITGSLSLYRGRGSRGLFLFPRELSRASHSSVSCWWGANIWWACTFRSYPSVHDLHANEAADSRWCLHDGAGPIPDVRLQGKAAKLGDGLTHW